MQERLDDLFDEQGVALALLEDESLHMIEARVVAEKRAGHLVAGLAPQGFDWKLRVVGLAAPPVLVLGAVVHQQQDTGRHDAVYQDVEHRLRLAVDPLEVLEH